MVRLRRLRAVVRSGVRFVMLSAIGRRKNRGFAGTVAVDHVRLIGLEPRVGWVGSMGSMELVRGAVDVDSGAWKMGLALLVGTRRSQTRRGSERQYESALSGRCARDGSVGERKVVRCPVCQGSECGKHDREYSRHQRKRREHQRQS